MLPSYVLKLSAHGVPPSQPVVQMGDSEPHTKALQDLFKETFSKYFEEHGKWRWVRPTSSTAVSYRRTIVALGLMVQIKTELL